MASRIFTQASTHAPLRVSPAASSNSNGGGSSGIRTPWLPRPHPEVKSTLVRVERSRQESDMAEEAKR